MKNYKLEQEKYIKEIDSNCKVYRHIKSGARILAISNDDDNKVFSIAFRTPAINSTGLTHILEHSVLCGSKKYPVKDPFVELLKTSLNTFLNAFTFPDKTMYPVASKTLKDFQNLMDIYLDAVFNPKIYEHKEIFNQEGWHYHILDENDPITYNGVVYNEMKGAYSDPAQILERSILNSLFPDTCYQYESGGDPKNIPDLSYEEFKLFHSKYYNPTNSYIILYGDLDMEERLSYLDKEYLSKYDINSFDTTIKYQKEFDKPIYKEIEYASSKEDKSTFLSYNVALPSTLDTKLTLAISILFQAILDMPGAPLKEALIKKGLASNIDDSFDDGLLQPMLSIIAYGSEKNYQKEFIETIDDVLKSFVKNGLDKDILLSIINYSEYKMRENYFSASMPKGLNIAINILSSWLYDDNKVFDKLELLKYFDEFRNDLNNGYFEKIIDKYILNNNHKTYLALIPSLTIKDKENKLLEDKLKKYKDSLSKEEINKLVEYNKYLQIYQATPSTKEELDTLPKLKLSDINPLPEKYNLEILNNKYKVLFSDYNTNGIIYYKLYFDISHLNRNDLMYLSLYIDMLQEVDTLNYKYNDLNKEIKKYTGGISVNITNYKHDKTLEALSYITVSGQALKNELNKLIPLMEEVSLKPNFNDINRIKERLLELKEDLTLSITGKGHRVALLRSLSYIDENSRNQDDVSGIAYLDFVSDLVNNFDNKINDIVSNFNKCKNYFTKSNIIVGITTSKDNLDFALNNIDSYYNDLIDDYNYEKEEFKENILNEAFLTEYKVSYNALSAKYDYKIYNGAMNVLNNAISMDYLWIKVRVNGGAYGCFINTSPYGYVSFASYRDPNILKTFDVYKNISNYLNEFNPDIDKLTSLKIGAIGNLQLVLHPRDMAENSRVAYLRGLTYEERKKTREELINATLDDIKKEFDIFKNVNKEYVITTIGNKEEIEKNKSLYKNIRNLEK